MIFFFCLFGLVAARDEARDVIVAGQYVMNEDGWRTYMGSKIAFDDVIKRKKYDLPNLAKYNVTFQQYNSEGSQRPALETALLANGIGAKIIVGPSFSSESVVVSLISNVFGIPTVSYSATSPALSNKATYPYFFRNVPSDAAQGKAVADLVSYFKQSKCVVISADDAYGLGITEVFREASRANSIEIVDSITVPASLEDTPENRETIDKLMQTASEAVYGDTVNSQVRVQRDVGSIVFFGASKILFTMILEIAEKRALIGTPEDAKFVWFAADGGTGLDLGPVNISPEAKTGMFGTGFGLPKTQLYEELMVPAWAEIAGCTYEFENVDYSYNCEFPFGPTGELIKIPEAVAGFAPYAYDSMLICLTAMDTILGRPGTDARNITGESLLEVLRGEDFAVDGVTGLNTFDETQDRKPSYALLNAQDGVWTEIGAYEAEVKITAPILFADQTADFPAFEFEEPLGAGVIALIAIVCVLLALLLLGLIGYFVSKSRKAAELTREAAANRDAEQWTAQEEVEEISRIEESGDIDDTQMLTHLSGQGSQKVFVERADENSPLFGVARGKRCAINEELTDTITLVNESSQARGYTITMPDCGTEFSFECTAKPGVGVLRKGERREIELKFKLLFTTKVARWLKVEFSGIDGAVYVPVRVEGEVSSRLDPMELELFGKPLGEGAFGIVYRGRYRGTQVAAKVPRKQGDIKKSHLDSFMAEIALFENLRNQYVVNFVGASHVPGKLCLCTELLERGTALELIHRAKVSLVLKIKICWDASQALAYLHKNGVLYRDLKPDNLLIFSVSHNATVNAKISDFGTAITVDDPSVAKKHTGSVGTPVYMAPEMMSNEPYGEKVDVYSLGMLVWEMMAEKAPFGHLKRIWDLPRLVLEGMRPEIDADWDKKIAKVIDSCWLHSAERRPTAEEAGDLLHKIYEKLRSDYEANKKSNKKGGSGVSESGISSQEGGPKVVPGRTAHTGQLNELIQMGKDHADDEFLAQSGDGMIAPAKDITKKKKKKKPSAE